MLAAMPQKEPWHVDSEGKFRRPPSFWRDTKLGQVLAFGAGALCLLNAVMRGAYSESHVDISVGGVLMMLGVALRALDIWATKK
jgi:hypothetical protein